jgi:RNA polymerase sigma-70 factor (ECF subfamily)
VEQSSEEAECWAASLAGSGEAFAVIFDLHRDRVYGYSLRFVANVHDAEDVTAGAFLELWRRRGSVRLVEGSVLPWLLVTASNLSRNTARRLRRHRALISSLPRSETASGAGEVAEGNIEAEQAARRVREALRSLSETDAALIALTAFEGLTPAEAGVAIGISAGAARTRLHRARARVASALDTSGAGGLTMQAGEESR